MLNFDGWNPMFFGISLLSGSSLFPINYASTKPLVVSRYRPFENMHKSNGIMQHHAGAQNFPKIFVQHGPLRSV